MSRSGSKRWRTAAFAVLPALTLLAGLAAIRAVDPSAAGLIGVVVVAGFAWFARFDRAQRGSLAQPPPSPAMPVPQPLLERLPDPVILLNSAREIVAINRAAREALNIEMVGRDLALSMRHPDVLAAVETVFAGQPSVTEEITLPVPVPRTFTLHAGALPASSEPDAPRIVLVLRDETRAKRAERSRADFVANATHELRSPLSALIGFIETLQGPASGDVVARERFLGIMQAEALRMARLVEDLMSLSRVEINEHVPPRHRVDLADVLAAVADTLAMRAETRQMTITIDCPDDLPQILGETDQLTQVFHNLVDNAVKYARSGTRITIVAHAVERMPGTQTSGVSIAVSDESEGIDSIHLPRLTERFYRSDAGRSRRLGGTGLGLAIVKHIINRHRGRMSIESKVGVGSTFTVYLPVAASTTQGMATKNTASGSL
jgi:two-component system, OmpR family, phosphate regulon sensor histidine kinase PhoR